jgi:integrase
MTVRRGKRKGQVVANVRPEVRARLERLGWERVLIYKMAVLTGLRRGELAALEVRHLFLDAPRPRVALPAWDTKGGSDADLPLRMDLATDLRAWIEATGKGEADRLFRVPTELVKILKRDLAHAGIPYRDGRGQTFDVHALRHTTQTHLAKAKVSPTIARGFMRHTDINLTLKTYTDPRLLDEAEALEALPDLPLSGGEGTNKKRGAAAG